MNYVLFKEPWNSWTLDHVGGKATSLALLVQSGIEVPDFFCVPVEAYTRFASEENIQRELTSVLKRLAEHVSVQQIEQISSGLQHSLSVTDIPREVEEQITTAYHEYLQGGIVAVRSSATAEDLPRASFAGQHESFLEVSGAPSVVEHVRRCWVSLWSARAIAYRTRMRVSHEQVRMAVLVQHMIDSDLSGVLFTANPQGRADEQLISAVAGGGEVLVSGETNPKDWVLRCKDSVYLASEKSVGTSGHVARLSNEQLQLLGATGKRIETLFEHPQDIEWTFSKGKLFVLQSRPITTCRRATIEFQVPEGSWTRHGLGEWLQEPMSPLFETLLMESLSSETDRLLRGTLGLIRSSPTWTSINGYYYARANLAPRFQLFLSPVKLWRAFHKSAKRWTESIVPEHHSRIESLRSFRPKVHSASNVLAHFDDTLRATATCWAWIVLTGMMAKTSETVFAFLYNRLCRGMDLPYTDLLAGYPNKSVESDEVLKELSKSADSNVSVRSIISQNTDEDALEALSSSSSTSSWYAAFSNWVSNYGHRVFELDILHQTMIDDPTIALRTLRSYLACPDAKSPEKRRQERAAQRTTTQETFLHQTRRMVLFGSILRRALSITQEYAAIRESRPFFLHLSWPLMRRDVLEIGARLASFGVLGKKEDVFFLAASELRDAASRLDTGKKEDLQRSGYPDRIVARRRLRENQLGLKPPLSIHPTFVAKLISRLSRRKSSTAVDASLTGIPASPGKAEGSACIVRSPEDFGKISPGQILIARYTTPAWTPLLAVASGVVTEFGGALSHAAIVCREYGVPAVVGVNELLARVEDGEKLEIDGSTGTVRKTGTD